MSVGQWQRLVAMEMKRKGALKEPSLKDPEAPPPVSKMRLWNPIPGYSSRKKALERSPSDAPILKGHFGSRASGASFTPLVLASHLVFCTANILLRPSLLTIHSVSNETLLLFSR